VTDAPDGFRVATRAAERRFIRSGVL